MPQHVLLVEDSVTDQLLYTHWLKTRLQAVVRHARTLAEAVRRLEEAWPDLIVLDLLLPDVPGMRQPFAAYDHLKQWTQEQVPILAHTGTAPVVEDAGAGGRPVAIKTADPTAFLERCQGVYQQHQAIQAIQATTAAILAPAKGTV